MVSMPDRDLAALDHYALLPRVLRPGDEVDCRQPWGERTLPSPVLPRLDAVAPAPADRPALVPADAVLEHPERYAAADAVPLLASVKMGELMPRVRRLAAAGAPALALDLTGLAATPPFGEGAWRPRSREDLAELKSASGGALWLYGVLGAADAEVAMEAGLDAVVVHSALGRHLGGPAAIEALPEILDAVAGTIGVFVGGPVRGGLDVFRYLAVGAEMVVVETDRSPERLDAELRYAMRLTGCETVADIGYEAIWAPLFDEA